MMSTPICPQSPTLSRSSGLLVLALVPLALLLGARLAGAEDLPPTSEFFDEFDANSDGRVESAEFRGSAEIFRLLDKDGDGFITAAELGLPADYKPDPMRKQRKAGEEARGDGNKRGSGKPGAMKRMEELRKRLLAMDTDKDGSVSREEWKGPEQAFDRLDRNKDGKLDEADRADKDKPGADRKRPRAGRPEPSMDPVAEEARMRAQFKQADKNGDGLLTPDEAPNPKLITAADSDGDKSLTVDEFVLYLQKRTQARRADAEAGPGGKPDGKGARGGRLTAGMIRRWDRDGDGKVSAEEFPGREAAFQGYDTDKDGFLTEVDVAAAKSRAPEDKPADDSFEACDKDGDGKLTRAEFQGTTEQWRALDKDGDGYLTRAEAGK